MLNRLHAIRKQLDERRRYQQLLNLLERMNAADVANAESLGSARDNVLPTIGCDRR